MFHAKSYETLSRFVQLMQKKNRGLFFSGHVLYNVLFYGEPVKRVRVKTVPVKTVRKKRVQVKTVLHCKEKRFQKRVSKGLLGVKGLLPCRKP